MTKYCYKNVYQLPKLEKIVLSFSFSQVSVKSLLPLVSALSLLSSQRTYLITSKRVPILLKVKSGLPIGCKVDLRGKNKVLFLEKLVFSILPRLKDICVNLKIGVVSFSISNLYIFKNIEKDYEHFPDLPRLNVNIVFKARSGVEVMDFLRAFRFPLAKTKK